ncbi:hypothetical protein [Humisphaera borealis]|uniref:Uncharacterized protein n=1 Tax=Humisphaera borealis TaxID=2807512 RepID=A0A7M2WT82_9BACT|nr:hypothetical protein [Humisphaera borealis]QOV88718.1 hypothetical protein IPV69_21175 [Humisphaera borealis]
MTQNPYPHAPYQPYRPPPDPAAPARRAAIMMWVMGTLAVIGGLCFAAVMPTFIDSMLNSNVPEAQQLRQQLAELEGKAGVSAKTQLLVSGMVLIIAGGILGVVAFFVRGGGKGGVIAGIVVVGLAIAYFVLNLLASVLMGGSPAQLALGACFMLVILGALGTTLKWLIDAVRNASRMGALQSQQQQMYGRYGQSSPQEPNPPAWPQQPGGYPPPGYSPPGQPPAVPPVGPPAQGGSFGPAPFGIPPPPDEAGGKYGYATKPSDETSQPPRHDGSV